MVEVENKTDKMVSFLNPNDRWYTLKPGEKEDIPKDAVWRARAHRLTEVPVKKEVKAPVVKKKSRSRKK